MVALTYKTLLRRDREWEVEVVYVRCVLRGAFVSVEMVSHRLAVFCLLSIRNRRADAHGVHPRSLTRRYEALRYRLSLCVGENAEDVR